MGARASLVAAASLPATAASLLAAASLSYTSNRPLC
jgi:hypothetical protein